MDNALVPDMITQPELWRCVIELTPSRLQIALVPPAPGESPVWRSIPVGSVEQARLKSIEDAVYESPLLLGEFKSISAIVDASRFAIVPSEALTPATDRLQLLDTIVGSKPDERQTVCPEVELGNATMIYSIDNSLDSFLRRTFFGVKIYSVLALEAAETVALSRGRVVMTVVADMPGRIEVVAALNGALLMANRFAYTHPIDAAYYVMASRSTLGLGRADGVVRLAGVHHNLKEIGEMVGRYVEHIERVVTPPSLCILGRETTKFSYPVDCLLTNCQM